MDIYDGSVAIRCSTIKQMHTVIDSMQEQIEDLEVYVSYCNWMDIYVYIDNNRIEARNIINSNISKIIECYDIKFLSGCELKLYEYMDDISTAFDIFKPEMKSFEKNINKKVSEALSIYNCDGYFVWKGGS